MEEQNGNQSRETYFTEDCAAQTRVMAQYGTVPTSIIFPRNQWTQEALDVCAKNGITSYRGTENHFLYRARTEAKQTNLFIRMFRLVDHYFNLSGHHTYTLTKTPGEILNIPASRFLRPYSRMLFLFEPIRLRRIKKAMTYAAKHNEVFHLWWHPHNFGTNQKQNLKNLHKIIRHYTHLNKKYGMLSLNMDELTTLLNE